MHLLLSIPSEKSTSFKLRVYLKNHLCTKVLCSFDFQDKKHWWCIPASPPVPTSTGSLVLRNQPPAVLRGKYLLEKSEFRMEKVSEKQGSSAVDILWWQPSSGTAPGQQQLLQVVHHTSTALSQDISSVEPWSELTLSVKGSAPWAILEPVWCLQSR